MYKYGLILTLVAMSATACGDENTNDFVATDNPLRCGSEGVENSEVKRLREAGRPATMEEAEAAPTGLLIHLENAIAWKRGAREAETVVHLNARLCGTQETKDRHGNRKLESIHCHDLHGTVNQNSEEVFYLTAGEAFSVVKDSYNGYHAQLEYKLTTQTSSTWYPGGALTIGRDLDRQKQSVRVRVLEAYKESYRDTVTYRNTGSEKVTQ